MSQVIGISRPHPHVLSVTLNRPEKLNAFNDELKHGLVDAVRAAASDPDVRAIVLKGAGRAFSVGADVGKAKRPEAASQPATYGSARSAADDYEILVQGTIETFLEVWRCPVPVVAQVHGYCLGIATVLMHCSDLVFCAEDTVFGWPAMPLGGGMIGPIWAHSVGAHRAKELSMTVGARLSGAEAASMGVVNRAVPASELDSTVDAVVGHITRLSRDLLRIKKAAVNQVQNRAGFEETVRAGAAWDALAHETDVVGETQSRIVLEGLKPVLGDWRPPTAGGRS